MPKPKPKTYKTAKRILQASLLDIQAGQWCKSSLLEYAEITSPYYQSGKQVLGEDDRPANFDPEADGHRMTYFAEVRGCALGLISMYAGLGTLEDFTQLGDGHIFMPRYAMTEDGPEIRKALIALVKAMPKTAFNRLCDKIDTETESQHDALLAKDATQMSVELLNQFIWNHNDQLSQKSAVNWFTKAIELV